MENALSAMVEKGLKTVCFTEHMDMDYPGGEFLLDAAAYRSRLVELREEFRGRIEVLFGVELGLMDYLAPRLREYVGAWDFDFVIGSSHLVGGVDPYYPEYFEKYGDHNGILRLFRDILANIRTFWTASTDLRPLVISCVLAAQRRSALPRYSVSRTRY